MDKSKEFIVDRIENGYCSEEFIADNFKNNSFTIAPFSCLSPELSKLVKNDTLSVIFEGTDEFNRVGCSIITIKYNPSEEFEYFTSDIMTHDGTLLFLEEAMSNIINKILRLGTYNANTAPEDLNEHIWEYNYEYVIGDFVVNNEFGKEYAPEDKPWMRQRQIVTLPIKWRCAKKEQYV